VTQNWLGNLTTAEANLTTAVSVCRSRRLPLLGASCLGHLSFTHYLAGREHAARRMAEEALAAAADIPAPERLFTITRARLVLDLCRFVDLPSINEADAHAATVDVHPADLSTRFWLQAREAWTRMLRGDLDGAGRALDMPLMLPVLPEVPDHLAVAVAVERSLVGALAGDDELLKELHHELESESFSGEAALVAGIRADLRGDRRQAVRMFDAAADELSFPQLGTRALALACEAQLLDALGDHERALGRLQAAAAETAVRRNAMPFLGWSRQGTPISTLVTELQRRMPAPWVMEIAEASAERPDVTAQFASSTATLAERARAPESMITPVLSSREREVLRELARGSTYADISANLFVSENTVKTHVSSLYGKLGAGRRSEALAIARSLHLL
jgi:DNA-binding CsgD family transcriptional regulator